MLTTRQALYIMSVCALAQTAAHAQPADLANDSHVTINDDLLNLQAKSHEYLSAKADFGAKADGKTDDSAALQSAIKAACASGKRLLLPVGTYLVSSPLALCSTLSFSGESDKTVVLKTGPGPAFTGTSVRAISLSDLAISGGAGGDSTSDGIHFVTSSNIRLQRLSVHGMAGSGIAFETAVHVKVEDCNITANRQHGVYSNLGSTITIEDSYLNLNALSGVTLNSAMGRVLSCILEQNGNGAVLRRTTLFLGNELEQNTSDAVVVSSDSIVFGNMIFPVHSNGIHVTGGNSAALAFNVFGTTTAYHILIDPAAKNVFVGPNTGLQRYLDNGSGTWKPSK
jgi:polygalacturonase